MNCCIECFSSSYLRDIIFSDSRKGNCNFCGAVDVSTYDPRELVPFFRNILNLYEADNESGNDIISILDLNFGDTIFSNNVENRFVLLKAIVEDELKEFNDIFENKVSLCQKEHSSISEDIHSKWGEFKNEIKNVNRFHIKSTIDLKKLKAIFENETFTTIFKKGKIFYRSRISEKLGLKKEEMGNPPREKATAGRANPKGISYLYLANDIVTSLYEARATLYDYVTVGDFRLKEDIQVLNLRKPNNDPIIWAEQEAISDYLTYIPFINTLQRELSLPIRRLDKEIDYLPTQYLSEFIKSIGFDGVEFQSSLYSDGFNLAIFNPHKFECIKANIYEIEKIKMQHKEL